MAAQPVPRADALHTSPVTPPPTTPRPTIGVAARRRCSLIQSVVHFAGFQRPRYQDSLRAIYTEWGERTNRGRLGWVVAAAQPGKGGVAGQSTPPHGGLNQGACAAS